MNSNQSVIDNYASEPKTSVFIDLLQTIVIALAICVIIYLFIATPNEVKGESMEPTFTEGELLLTNKIVQYLAPTGIVNDYQRGDVVIFNDNLTKDDFIKRVIGVPGDSVRIEDGLVYVNEQKLQEEYLNNGIETSGGTFLEEGKTIQIPSNKYIVLGDNREKSQDSRFREVALVDRNQLKGRVFFRYWPLSDFGIVTHYDYGI